MSAMVHGNQTCSNGGVTIAGSVVSSTRPIAEWGGRRACARVWVVRVVGSRVSFLWCRMWNVLGSGTLGEGIDCSV